MAALHTQILQQTVLKDFYALQPEKFNNKTNGVSHRRFLLQSNPALSEFLTKTLGPAWIQDPTQLEGLLAYREDTEFLRDLARVRRKGKERLADYIGRYFGITCDPDSVFDIQVKRIHAYKRQLLNAFKIVALYDRLRDDPYAAVPPSTFVFAGKAAHSYTFAKDVIRFVCAVAGHGQRRSPDLPADEGGVHGELRGDHGADHLPGGGHIRADIHCGQGGQRHGVHEIHVQRGGDPGDAGRGQCGDPGPGGGGEHLHFRFDGGGDHALLQRGGVFRGGRGGGEPGAGPGAGAPDRRVAGRHILGSAGQPAQA